jgi:alpha-galactosidase
MISVKSLIACLPLLVWCGATYAQVSALRPVPPNNPATVEIQGNSIAIRYDGKTIFSGQIRSDSASVTQRTQVYRKGNAIQQVILLTTMDWHKKITISGTVLASEESFPCEADRPTDRASQGPLIVRNASGLGRNLRNRAIYDRHSDWVLSVDANPKVVVTPATMKQNENSFSLEIEGYEIILRFRPHFFQYHRGLEFFEPWNYKVWPGSVAGWISWFAFFDKVTERDMVETADVFSSTLGPFGYEYFQMDDGYQKGNGEPELWLKPNEKFPNGLKYLADYIRSKGLKPGLWMGVGFFDGEFAGKHSDWFLRDSLGNLLAGNWIQYPLDAANDEALNGIVRPIFKGFRAQGWEYFKVDGLRHLRYEGYNANRSYFDKKNINLVDAYRRYAQTVREEIGRDHFMLGCWGIRPELVGIIDGCRIGDDGFSYAGLAQYNSFNNIVWRNDPDHIELNEGAYRSTMVTSLTGSLLMLTDKPAVYRTSVIEPAKRAVPVLFTRPGQLYDVDPSRSDNLFRVDAEVSGSGPRPFDAGYTPQCFLYSLEINRPFGSWIVLGRTGGDFPVISFADLGIPSDREFLVFEFWTKSLLGTFSKGFDPGKINPSYGCQLFCIRQRETHPQLVATSRHISCGGYELKALSWVGSTLSGISEIVGNDAYTLYVLESPEYSYQSVECTGAKVVASTKRGMVREVTVLSDSSAVVSWRIKY